LTVTYYAQRASAGLIISEGVFPSAMGKGYVHTPGIETGAQATQPERKSPRPCMLVAAAYSCN